ncbi:TetR/AcrR family transcriptional regulator [Aurantivibrio plasticivorans]
MSEISDVAEITRPYHHGDLKQTLIDAACRHIASGGTEKLSLRALAREAGVSPTAPYRHFSTKNSLLASIAYEGFSELQKCLDTISEQKISDPYERLVKLGVAYVNYAVENPVKYHLMFGDVLADFTAYENLQKSVETVFALVARELNQAKEEGFVSEAPFEELAAYVWSCLHGLANLIVNKRRRLEFPDKTLGISVIHYLTQNVEKIMKRVIQGLSMA